MEILKRLAGWLSHHLLFLVVTAFLLATVACAYFTFGVLAPWVDNVWVTVKDHIPDAAVDTYEYFQETYPYVPEDVKVSTQVKSMAENAGLTEYDIQALIAAANRAKIRWEHLIAVAIHYPSWLVGYPDTFPAALKLADEIHGAGVYIPFDPTLVLLAFNPDGGLEWVQQVLETADQWDGPLGSIEIIYEESVDAFAIASIFIEMLRFRILGPDAFVYDGEIPIVPDGTFVNPHPGSGRCGYPYGVPVGKGFHWGLDLCAGEAPVVAAHNCVVTFSGFIDRKSAQAISWWVSGNTVGCTGQLPDGTTVWSVYGHGKDGSVAVRVGDSLGAGQFIFTSNCHEGDVREFCTGDHLHFGMKLNDGWVDPNLLIP